MTSEVISRVYIGARLAIGRNAISDRARPSPARAGRPPAPLAAPFARHAPVPPPIPGEVRSLPVSARRRHGTPSTLTSNVCSVSWPDKEARVTKHDAERKVKILDFIAATLRARGYPPSVREIARAVGLASTSAVHHHLQILEREGYLERGAAQSRAIRLTPTAAIRLGLTSELVPQATTGDARVVPIIGEIAAGGPIEAYQDATETMAIPDILAPGGDAYVLRVRGDSMIEAHIADGDFVLIRPQTTARNGDIVVAQVEENAVTLKRFFKEKDQIRLQPANPAYPAAVLRRRPHPGQADRRHPPARLRRRAGRPMRALAGSARSLTH